MTEALGLDLLWFLCSINGFEVREDGVERAVCHQAVVAISNCKRCAWKLIAVNELNSLSGGPLRAVGGGCSYHSEIIPWFNSPRAVVDCITSQSTIHWPIAMLPRISRRFCMTSSAWLGLRPSG